MLCPECNKEMQEACVNEHEIWWCSVCSPDMTLDLALEALINLADVPLLTPKEAGMQEWDVDFRECSMCHEMNVLPDSWFPICPNCEFKINLGGSNA